MAACTATARLLREVAIVGADDLSGEAASLVDSDVAGSFDTARASSASRLAHAHADTADVWPTGHILYSTPAFADRSEGGAI